ncbi:fatty acid synthase [Nasonia vitripennis]|uniref:Uncharacterized protein n=1 Tax=Nasonia vitripennis TaxID=7425 RepID=A0A7M7H5T0_NASVI|nr:fatty acid synthase [Nasonia vitripennis]XP_031786889.1 fatty acid synthase [Nasonia vitripennis]
MKSDCGTAEDAVVISGIAGRFPKANNVLEFRKNLCEKVDCTTSNHGRWNIDHPAIPSKFGVIRGVEKFDRVYFAVHEKLSKKMEAAAKLLLEHSVEAIIDAGINPNDLKGRNVAVYVNTNVTETQSLFSDIKADGFEIVGSAKAMIPNRISFSMGLTGTSIHIDVGSAGGIATLEKAFHALKNDECEGAIIAGGIMILQPEIALQLKQQGLLSSEGKSRSFDDNATGHFRSDGVAAMYLQKAKNAKRIYMEVMGARATHTDCIKVNSFLFPKLDSQVKLMKQVLNDCGLSPDDIAYLEASGFAIKSIDADELEAIDRVYGKRKEPLYVSSVISNVGNATPVNAYNAIVKAILGMEDKKILPNLNYEKPNSKASGLISGRLRVPTEVTPVKGQYVAINIISESGVFASAILKSPDIKKTNNDPKDELPRLVVVSGRTEEAIDAILTFLETNPVDVELCQMLNDLFEFGVEKHIQKGYTILPANGVLHKKLQIRGTNAFTGVKRQVWWVFSGMGSQWAGMGTELLKIAVFNYAIKKCDNVLKPLGYDIYKIITDKDPKMFDNIIHSFIGIAAVQIGLVDVLRFVGLEPDFIIGHSVGELGCAYADGCVTAEQMILAALSRGLASKEVDLIPGSMAAVGLGYDAVKPLCPPDIDVACHNGPDSTTISGPAESMKKFVASLTAKGIFAREVASSGIAYHSRYIAPAGPKLLERLQQVIPNPNPRSAKWVSTSVPKAEWNSLKARLCSAEYHTNNLLSPVLFDETARQIPNGSICIEIAPHGLLQAILKKSLHSSCTNIALTKRGHYDNSALVLAALGKMYALDLNPKISNLYPKIKYPVGTGTPSISPLIKWDHTNQNCIDYYESKMSVIEGEKTIEIDLNKADHDFLNANTINGKIVTPLSSCLNTAWETLKNWQTLNTKEPDAKEILNVVFDDIKVYKSVLNIPDDNIVKVLVAVLKGTGRIEIIDEKSREIIASAVIKSTTAPSQERFDIENSKYRKLEKYEIDQEDFYTEMEMRGFNYSKVFKNVLRTTSDGSNGIVRWDNNWVTFIDSVLQLYAFGNDTRQALVPVSIRKIVIDINKQVNEVNDSDEVNVMIDRSLNYISAGGLEIQGLQFARLPKQHEQSYMSNDVPTVVPNIDNSSTPLPVVLRLVLQIIIENNFSEKLQRIELVGDRDSNNMKLIQNAFVDVPEINWFKQDITSLESATYGNILTIIISNANDYNIEEISNRLNEGKFLLMNLPNAKQDSYLNSVGKFGLMPVFLRKTENETVVLLRKIRLTRKIHKIHITESNKQSAEMICKSAKNLPDSERVAVLIQSNQNVNSAISEIVQQIELTGFNLSKIRIFLFHGVKGIEDSIAEEFYKHQLELDLLINILTPQKVWATLRRTTAILNEKMCQTWAANQTSLNKPLSISWTEGRPLDSIGNSVQVEYSTINPQDLLIADGSFYVEGLEKSRIEQIGVGLEYSGIDQKLSRVMGITCGNSVANFVNVNPTWMWDVPKTWSFEDAVTVPLSYVLAYWALIVKAEAEAKERVLVTNVCDGISLATINLALHKKCDVFVAYERESEKEMISLTFPQIQSNRLFKLTNNSFRDEILLQTKGEGVNVVIANQCEIKQLEVFFSAIKQNARAVVISDLNNSEIHGKVGMYIFLKELNFFSVVPKKVLLSDLKIKKMLANMVQEGINIGSVKPLPRRVYQRESLAEALNTCLAKENLGKIVIKVAPKDAKMECQDALAIPRLHCLDRKSYLVIEGLTTFGLELIDWLITRGARQIVVASSMKIENGFQNLRIRIWQGYGVKINLHTETDLAEQKSIKALFKDASSLGAIDAIFDLRRIDFEKHKFLSNALDSTTKILDQESRNLCSELRLFVVCSAVANAGALANTRKTDRYSITSFEQKLVDEIVEKRKKDGLPGLIVRLGLVNSTHTNSNNLTKNIVLPACSKYVLKLDEIFGTNENIVEVSSFVSLANEIEEYVDPSKRNLNDEDRLKKLFADDLHGPNCKIVHILKML